MEEEIKRLESIDILTLISYVDSLFEIMTNLKVEEAEDVVRSKLQEALQDQHE